MHPNSSRERVLILMKDLLYIFFCDCQIKHYYIFFSLSKKDEADVSMSWIRIVVEPWIMIPKLICVPSFLREKRHEQFKCGIIPSIYDIFIERQRNSHNTWLWFSSRKRNSFHNSKTTLDNMSFLRCQWNKSKRTDDRHQSWKTRNEKPYLLLKA
jgi:hypothetical protein